MIYTEKFRSKLNTGLYAK